jgi:hypothetical protein
MLTNNIANSRYPPFLRTADIELDDDLSDAVLSSNAVLSDELFFVRCSFIRRSFCQRQFLSALRLLIYDGVGQLRCRSIQTLCLPCAPLGAPTRGFLDRVISLGPTGIRAAFIFNAEHRVQST